MPTATETRAQQVLEGEVVYSPIGPNPQYFSIFPRFGTLAHKVDAVASRVPWWAWVGGTLVAVWWLNNRRGNKVRIVSE